MKNVGWEATIRDGMAITRMSYYCLRKTMADEPTFVLRTATENRLCR